MIIKQITRYYQGKLGKEEEWELWVRLLQNPDELELFAIYGRYKQLYTDQTHSG